MDTSYIREISQESWSGYVFFIIGYCASIFSTLSSDLRENNLSLAIGMMIGFSALVGIGIWLQARSNVASNRKIMDLEKRIQSLEEKLQHKN